MQANRQKIQAVVVTIGITGKNYLQQELEKIETNSVELEYAASAATSGLSPPWKRRGSTSARFNTSRNTVRNILALRAIF
jgi:hypothetical protein